MAEIITNDSNTLVGISVTLSVSVIDTINIVSIIRRAMTSGGAVVVLSIISGLPKMG